MPGQQLVAFEFEPQLVKLVAVRQHGARVLVERAEHAPSLEQLLANQHVGRARSAHWWGGAHCAAALPREEAFSRVLTLPSTEAGELRPMVELHAKSLLPYGQAEVVIDFLTLGRTATHTTILLLGMRRPTVEHYVSMMREAGIADPHVTLATSGLLQWYRAVRSQLQLAGTVVLLEVDALSAECLIISDDTLRYTRHIPISATPTWLEELDRTLQSYLQEQIGDAPTHVVLTGDPAVVAEVLAPLQDVLHMPVRSVEAWTAVTALPGVTLPRSGAWSATLGLALAAGGSPSINLLPAEMREVRAQRLLQRAWLVTVGLAIAVLTAASLWLQLDLRQHRQLSQRLTHELRRVEPRAQRLAHDVERVQRVHQALSQRGQSLALLQDLYHLTPQHISVTQWLLEAGQEVRIRGIASTLSEVLAYVTSLERSDALHDVQLRYSSERVTPQGTQVEFELVCHADR